MQMQRMDSDGDLFDIPQTAAYLGVCQRTVRRWLKAKRIPFIRIGDKLIRIRRSDLDAFIAGNTSGPRGEA